MERRRRKAQDDVRGSKSVIAVTFQIVRTAKTYDLSSNPHEQAARRKRGDIIGFFRTDKYASFDDANNQWRWSTPIGHPNCVFIHARGFNRERFSNAKRRFTEDLTVNNIGRLDETDEEALHARRCRWLIAYDELPPQAKENLRDHKEHTMPWTSLQPLTRKRRYIVLEDPDSDDETQPVDESDVPEDIVVPG